MYSNSKRVDYDGMRIWTNGEEEEKQELMGIKFHRQSHFKGFKYLRVTRFGLGWPNLVVVRVFPMIMVKEYENFRKGWTEISKHQHTHIHHEHTKAWMEGRPTTDPIWY